MEMIYLYITLMILVFAIVIIQLSHSRYHRQGEVNAEIEENYGAPQRSLYVSTKFFTLHQATDITDDDENVVYHAQSKMLTLHDRTTITDASGNEVSQFYAKFFTLHARHFITMNDGSSFQLWREFWHVYKDVMNIEELGWVMEGNIWAMHFTIKDANGNLIAFISQKIISIHDKYSIDIYDTRYEAYIITIVIVLQHMIRQRQAAQSSSSSSSGSSNG